MLVLSVICVVVSFIFLIINIARGDAGWSLLWLFILFLNAYSLYNELNDNKKDGEYETHIIQDVQGYSVDSTTVINGADTTKTYILTYWK